MKKRALSILLALLLLLTPLLALPVSAAELVDSGTCGKNLTWTLDDEGTLTISGTGEMKARSTTATRSCCSAMCPAWT